MNEAYSVHVTLVALPEYSGTKKVVEDFNQQTFFP